MILFQLKYFPVLSMLGIFLALGVAGDCFGENYSGPLSQLKPHRPIAEVAGTLVGSGAPVLIGNRARVLTNAHILGSADQAKVRLWAPSGRLSNFFSMTVEFQDALADIAVLKVTDGDVEGEALLRELSSANFKFVPKSESRGGFEVISPYTSSGEHISAVVDGQPVLVKSLSPWQAKNIPDTYISGLYSGIWLTPTYARPGMSGGTYEIYGRGAGMLTKVDLGGSANAYVIPFSEIAGILGWHYFNEAHDSAWPQSRWMNHGDLEVVLASGTRLLATGQLGQTGSAGGEAGNGGGEAGNGGNQIFRTDLDSSRYWKIAGRDSQSRFEVSIANPFQTNPRSLLVDAQVISFIEINYPQLSQKNTYMAATLARYLWLTKHSSQSKWKAQVLGSKSEHQLLAARRHALRGPQFARTYLKPSAGDYQMIRAVEAGTVFGDGAQALFPQANQWYRAAKLGLAPERMPLFSTQADTNGYFQGLPLSAKGESRGLWFEVVFNANAYANSGNGFSIRADRKLSTIEFVSASGEVESLNRTSRGDAATFIFQSSIPQSKVRAAVVFAEQNLAIVERVFIDTPQVLIELIMCIPGKECWR